MNERQYQLSKALPTSTVQKVLDALVAREPDDDGPVPEFTPMAVARVRKWIIDVLGQAVRERLAQEAEHDVPCELSWDDLRKGLAEVDYQGAADRASR
jgi:hypothetical protein